MFTSASAIVAVDFFIVGVLLCISWRLSRRALVISFLAFFSRRRAWFFFGGFGVEVIDLSIYLFIPDPSSVMAAQFGFELQYDN